MEWVKVYELAEDATMIEQAQRRSLEPGRLGLQPEPALLGSVEWWSAVGSGDLESHWTTGVIGRPLWESMNDWPAVEVVEENSAVSTWTREGDVTQYSKGRGIRIRWVWQKLKQPVEGLPDPHPLVLEVWLEAGAWQPTAAFGPGPGRALDEGWEGGPAD